MTRVLVAAIYLKVEHLFFDETLSRMDVATAFHCNLSQMTRAVTGVNYKGGPHHYKPKPKTVTKRSCDSTDLNPDLAKKTKTKQGQPSTSKQADTVMQKPGTVVKEDTLSSSSSSSDEELPLGLKIYVVPPQSWGDQGDTKHSKCLLLGDRRLNQLTLIPKPNGSGGARAAMAQVGPANKRNDTKRCLPIEASLRPGEAVPW